MWVLGSLMLALISGRLNISRWCVAIHGLTITGLPVVFQFPVLATSTDQDGEECTTSKLSSLVTVPAFAEVYLQAGAPYSAGSRLVQNALAHTLEQLGREGLDSYYRGELAATHARYLEEQGSPRLIRLYFPGTCNSVLTCYRL